MQSMESVENFSNNDSAVMESVNETSVREQPVIEIVDQGRAVYVPHPEIIDQELLNSTNLIPRDSQVRIEFSPDCEYEMPFHEYLMLLGFASYDRYKSYCQQYPDLDQKEILRNIQTIIIKNRLELARIRHKKFLEQGKSFENQEVSTQEHSFIWRKIINDSSLPGIEAESANKVFDYLDGIDEFLTLDLKELGISETDIPVRIGIQRSFRDKEDEVRKSPFRNIPELAQQGTVYRVFIRDFDGDYDMYDKMIEARNQLINREAEKNHVTFLEYITQQAELKHISTKEYMGTRLERLPLEKFLTNGLAEQLSRAEHIITETIYQLETYIPQVKVWERQSLLDSIKGLRKILETIKDEQIATRK